VIFPILDDDDHHHYHHDNYDDDEDNNDDNGVYKQMKVRYMYNSLFKDKKFVSCSTKAVDFKKYLEFHKCCKI
jgi:hypothetical protein